MLYNKDLGAKKVNDWFHTRELQDGQVKIMRKERPCHCGDTHTIPKDRSDPSLVLEVRRFFFFPADPGYTSDFDMHVFSVDFIHLLE